MRALGDRFARLTLPELVIVSLCTGYAAGLLIILFFAARTIIAITRDHRWYQIKRFQEHHHDRL